MRGIAVGDRLRACGSHRNQVAYLHEGLSRLRKRSGGGHMSWTRGKRCPSQREIAWELYRRKTAAPSGSTSSGIPYAASTPCRAVLRVTGPSGSVLKIIFAPCFSLLTSCYLPRVTHDLFFLLVVNGIFAVGCRSLKDLSCTPTTSRLHCEVGTLSTSVE